MKLFFALLCGISITLIADEVAYLFSHGLYCDYTLAYYYENIRQPNELIIVDNKELHLDHIPGLKHIWHVQDPQDMRLWLIQQPLQTFNFPDATKNGFDGSQTSLGQTNEIQALANAYEKIKQKKVVLMGMSRGASTILNFLATRKPTSVAAAVVESPFDSITDALDLFCKNAGVNWIPYGILHTSPNWFFGKFDRRGIFPIKVVHNINKEIPILIVASLQDALIPAHNTASLYLKLRDHGHEHVYFLLLDHGEHGYLLENIDAPLYFNTVHAFYEKYNLPHNHAFASQGKNLLAQCQPSKKVVDEALKNKKSFITR